MHKNLRFKQMVVAAVVTVMLTATLSGCATVAVSGRRQLIIIPDSQLLSTSRLQYSEFLKENPLSTDEKATAMVHRVGQRVQNAVEQYFASRGKSSALRGYEWEFNLVESEQANAWCMPGGKVVFYTGILDVCGDESGVAVVMGHEVAHAVAKHGAERMSQNLLVQSGGMALGAALQKHPEKTQNMWMSAFGLGATVGVLLPFSRTHESEADQLGLTFMAMAGYDPREAAMFWQRMSESQQGSAPPEFLSTHPSDETRIRKIREHLPEALTHYKGGQ